MLYVVECGLLRIAFCKYLSETQKNKSSNENRNNLNCRKLKVYIVSINQMFSPLFELEYQRQPHITSEVPPCDHFVKQHAQVSNHPTTYISLQHI